MGAFEDLHRDRISGSLAFADREAATGVDDTYQYVVGSTAFHFVVQDGSVDLRYGRAAHPAVTVTTDDDTWADLASGKTTAVTATAAGALTVDGEPRAVRRLRRIFSRSRLFAQADGIVRSARRQR
jgi:putative sterol carrier protein